MISHIECSTNREGHQDRNFSFPREFESIKTDRLFLSLYSLYLAFYIKNLKCKLNCGSSALLFCYFFQFLKSRSREDQQFSFLREYDIFVGYGHDANNSLAHAFVVFRNRDRVIVFDPSFLQYTVFSNYVNNIETEFIELLPNKLVMNQLVMILFESACIEIGSKELDKLRTQGCYRLPVTGVFITQDSVTNRNYLKVVKLVRNSKSRINI